MSGKHVDTLFQILQTIALISQFLSVLHNISISQHHQLFSYYCGIEEIQTSLTQFVGISFMVCQQV